MTKRPRRTFTDEFKSQMVQLYNNGKARAEIIKEYDLTPSSLDKWIKQSQESGPFKEKDNRTVEENEMIRLRKENQRLLMENDLFFTNFFGGPDYINLIFITVKNHFGKSGAFHIEL